MPKIVLQKNSDAVKTVGRRKTSVSRIKLELGGGKIVINNKPLNEYFPAIDLQNIVLEPLKKIGKEKDFDVNVVVSGGGTRGQVVAVQLGIARALVKYNEDWKKTLKTLGLLTRDARIKERKKFGLKKARRAPQWAKR